MARRDRSDRRRSSDIEEMPDDVQGAEYDFDISVGDDSASSEPVPVATASNETIDGVSGNADSANPDNATSDATGTSAKTRAPKVERIKEFHEQIHSLDVTRVVHKSATPNADGTTFYILKGKIPGHKIDSIFCNHKGDIVAGDTLNVSGTISDVEDRRNPDRMEKRLQTTYVSAVMPESVSGLRRWLENNIENVGPATSERIVGMLGSGKNAHKKFMDVDLMIEAGVPEKYAKAIFEVASKEGPKLESYLFLSSLLDEKTNRPIFHSGNITAINKAYHPALIETVVRGNPWVLTKISGVGFATASKAGKALGFASDSPERICAGLIEAINKLGSDKGNTANIRSEILERACNDKSSDKILDDVPISVVEPYLDKMIERKELVESDGLIYTSDMWNCEDNIVKRIKKLLRKPAYVTREKAEQIVNRASKLEGVTLRDAQFEAVVYGVMYPVCIITGGPGTGKSTVQKVLFRCLNNPESNRLKNVDGPQINGDDEEPIIPVSASCPTGKAAVRLTEASGQPAQTVHRQLAYSPKEERFTRNQDNPIPARAIATDEASMLDTKLFNSLLDAIHTDSSLLLIGDDDQLPSVDAGNILKDLIDSGLIPTVKLRGARRTGVGSGIPVASQRILDGFYPLNEGETLRGFNHINIDTKLTMEETLDIATREVLKQGLSPSADVMLMSPMKKYESGVYKLNDALKDLINPSTFSPEKSGEDTRELEFQSRSFDLGGKKELHTTINDVVMNVKNDSESGIMNGESGIIVDYTFVPIYNAEGQPTGNKKETVRVDFNGNVVTIDPKKLGNIVHDYAKTIHKSQGSESTVSVIVIPSNAKRMANKNLLFTGLTRAKGVVYLIGSAEDIMHCINNTEKRRTGLRDKLRAEIPEIRRYLEEVGSPTDFFEKNDALIKERFDHAEKVRLRGENSTGAPKWAINQTRKVSRFKGVKRVTPPVRRPGIPRLIPGRPAVNRAVGKAPATSHVNRPETNQAGINQATKILKDQNQSATIQNPGQVTPVPQPVQARTPVRQNVIRPVAPRPGVARPVTPVSPRPQAVRPSVANNQNAGTPTPERQAEIKTDTPSKSTPPVARTIPARTPVQRAPVQRVPNVVGRPIANRPIAPRPGVSKVAPSIRPATSDTPAKSNGDTPKSDTPKPEPATSNPDTSNLVDKETTGSEIHPVRTASIPPRPSVIRRPIVTQRPVARPVSPRPMPNKTSP